MPQAATAMCKYCAFKQALQQQLFMCTCSAVKRAPRAAVTLEKWEPMPACYRLIYMCCWFCPSNIQWF